MSGSKCWRIFSTTAAVVVSSCARLAGLSKTIALTLLAILDNSLSSVEIIISSCGKALLAWIIVHSKVLYIIN